LSGIASGQEIGEIKRSLPSSSVLTYPSNGVTVILIVSKASEAENVERVLKGLGVKPLTIPSGYPQNLKDAAAQVLAETESLRKELELVEDELARLVAEKGAELVSLRMDTRWLERL
jgi:vacuolar-type H+-ATPase subunit I/STV1